MPTVIVRDKDGKEFQGVTSPKLDRICAEIKKKSKEAADRTYQQMARSTADGLAHSKIRF